MEKRNIDILMEEYEFHYIDQKESSNFRKTYDAIVRDIAVGNITNELYFITYDLIMVMARDEWEFIFDKVEFEKDVRNKHRAQCRYIRMLPYKEDLVTILYEIKILDKNNR